MSVVSVKQALSGSVPVNSEVTVRGWVRTRRDSKAGLSFVNVSDGSCFDPIQVVAPNTLANYADEIVKADRRLCRDRNRHAGAVAGQGPELRDPGIEGRSRRLGRRSGNLSDPAEGAHDGVPARGRAPAPAHEYVRRRRARARLHRQGDPPLLPRARLLLDQHADHHGERRRRRRPDVPRFDARHGQPAAQSGNRRNRLAPGFLRQGNLSDRLRPAQCRGLLPEPEQGVHVRPDVPRREFEYDAPPRRILDDRAGNRVRRPQRQRDRWPRISSSTSSRPCSTSAWTT